ncbi:hypothetical protein CKA32_003777 [Geitlerinema sp. FC II]|nr:hypothetical protein CKA32_003777 [Geitlerinema sp. FC II]
MVCGFRISQTETTPTGRNTRLSESDNAEESVTEPSLALRNATQSR